MTPADDELWRCPLCRADHPEPRQRCRRCGADLLAFVRLERAARAAATRGDAALVAVLRGGAAAHGHRSAHGPEDASGRPDR